MSCDVCIGTGETYDQAEFFREHTPRARRQHKCYECGEPIPVGAQYVRISGKWDGRMDTIRQCLPCNEIQRVFSCGEGFYYGQLWDAMDEMGFENLTTASECFRELTTPSKEFLLRRWRIWKGLK